MRIKFEPLMALMNYANNYKPLYISHSLSSPNSIWITEYQRESRRIGDYLVYSFDEQRIKSMSGYWTVFFHRVKTKDDMLYQYMEMDLEDFIKRCPTTEWFLPELVQGELV